MRLFAQILLLLGLTGFSQFLLADQQDEPTPEPPTIEIQYFGYVDLNNNGNPTAVLCGFVRGQLGHHSQVVITVDPRSRLAPEFVTVPNGDGRFCQTVATYSGRAEVEIRNLMGGETAKTKKVTAVAARQ